METSTIAFAFIAGMVATVNPCGFGLAPAYLSILLKPSSPTRSGFRRGLLVGGWVTAGFVSLFSVVGIIVRTVSTTVISLVPWLALVVGAGTIATGIWVLAGRRLRISGINVHFQKDGSVRSLVGFGIAYGVASLSCTLPVFLAVTTAAFAAPDAVAGIATFAAYGLGMGLVLTGVAVSVATAQSTLVDRIRRIQPLVDRIGGWLMVLAGGFVVYYWATVLAVPVTDPGPWYEPIRVVDGVSNTLRQLISNRPWTTVAVLGSTMIVLGVWSRQMSAKQSESAPSLPPADGR